MIILAVFAFISGIVTILSPCILPVLPIVLSGSVGGKRKAVGVVVGFVASFSIFTLALSALVQTFNIPGDTLRLVAVIVLVAFGVSMAIPSIQMKLEGLLSRLVRSKGSSQKSGFTGGLLTGLSLGLVWTPCVGPIMASVITLAVSQQIDGGAVVLVVSYSLGTSLPMFAIMIGGRTLLNRFPKLAAKTGEIQRIFGIVLIVVALLIGFGVDRRFQSFILDAFPNYGTGLTQFENSTLVRDALDERGNSKTQIWEYIPKDGKLGNFGPAPQFVAEGPWINTELPLSMGDLQGKVVLLDFWTYSCVNCVRTIPHLRSWYEKYKKYGFEIIGVHTPEFPFERNINNVKQAVQELGVTWPVVLDNGFSQWNAYQNRYWPAHFFIDAKGNVRYFSFGEGAYEESEQVIQKLLKEAGQSVNETTATELPLDTGNRTAEIYLGYARSTALVSEKQVHDQDAMYQLPQSLELGKWALEGMWTIRNDFIEVDGTGTLQLAFEAKDVFVVVEPRDAASVLHFEFDADSPNTKEGTIKVQESKLYHLGSFEVSARHLLTLTIKGHVRLYTFTFG